LKGRDSHSKQFSYQRESYLSEGEGEGAEPKTKKSHERNPRKLAEHMVNYETFESS